MLFSIKKAVVLTVLAFSLSSCANKDPIPVPSTDGTLSVACSDQTYQGFPRLELKMRSSYFVCHEGFALQYSGRFHSALWVTEKLVASNLDEKLVSRENEKFRPDGFLPEGVTPEPKFWSNSGFDRGHLAPAADFAENPVAMKRSFYTSNIVPQNPDNNRRVWAKLEKNVRAWARQKGEVYVVTGPIFHAGGRVGTPVGWISLNPKEQKYIIEEYHQEEVYDPAKQKKVKQKKKSEIRQGIAVPSHLYKIIYDPKTKQGIAFVLPNAPVPENDLARYATTIAEVERLTMIRFFPNLPMEEQAQIKTNVAPQNWLIGL